MSDPRQMWSSRNARARGTVTGKPVPPRDEAIEPLAISTNCRCACRYLRLALSEVKDGSPDERLSGARYPGLRVPHVASSREERDLAHAGYESAYLDCCLLYTSDAADERSSVDLGGRRI